MTSEDTNRRDDEVQVRKLDWKDFIAFGIAALQTTFFPIIIIMLVLIAFGTIMIHLWRP